MVVKTVVQEDRTTAGSAAFVTLSLRLPSGKDRERIARDIEEYNRVLAVNAGLN